MEYNDLLNEYTSLLRDKTVWQNTLAALKDGYISTKTISNKKYSYLQYRVDGKLLSEYVKDENLTDVIDELDKRADTIQKIKSADERLSKIEAAAEILDGNFRRRLINLRRCAALETMPYEEREKSLAFGSAMTALEGIPVSEIIEKNLSRWANGDFSFQESYLNTLKTYRLAEV